MTSNHDLIARLLARTEPVRASLPTDDSEWRRIISKKGSSDHHVAEVVREIAHDANLVLDLEAAADGLARLTAERDAELGERDQARAEVARLRALLAKYGRHSDDCPQVPDMYYCQCGWNGVEAARKGQP